MNDRLRHYAAKLEWEIDPSDLREALDDARKAEHRQRNVAAGRHHHQP